MKHNEIKELEKINIENFENLFNVYQDKDGMYFYNLLQTIVFPQNLPQNLYTEYVTKHGDTWPVISYNVYNNTALWWLICLANNIQNSVEPIKAGMELLIPIPAVVREVLTQMRSS